MTGIRLADRMTRLGTESAFEVLARVPPPPGHHRAGLNDIPGITCLEPQGAFYAFPNITGTGQTSADLQARLLADAGVAALAGTAFGPWGEGFLRFSYANSVENIRLALEAIRAQLT